LSNDIKETKIIDKIEYKRYRLEIKSLMNDFSEYEKKIVELIFSKGCKTILVAKIMREKYPHLKAAYIRIDCNTVMAKFRSRLKKFIKGLDPEIQKNISQLLNAKKQ
jgi:predicted Fe-Mo cluster-binding NifX family protein